MKPVILTISVCFIIFGCNRVDGPKPVTSSSSSASSSTTSTASSVDTACTKMAQLAAKITTFALLSQSDPLSEFSGAADNFVDEKLDRNIIAIPFNSQIHGNIALRDYELSVGGVPFCSNDLTVYLRPKTNELWMKGRIPNIEGLPSSELETIPYLKFPTQEFAVSTIYKKLNLKGDISSPKTLKRCVIFENDQFTPAIKVGFAVGGRPYIGLATLTNEFALVAGLDPYVRSASPAYLEEAETVETAEGTARVAVRATAVSSSGSSSIVYESKSVNLTGLSPGGSLCSQDFVVLSLTGHPRSPMVNAPPRSDTRDFSYSEADNNFYAATTFYNASSHVNWLLEHGILPNWPGPQVQIILNQTNTADDGGNNGINNTAVYLPNGNTFDDPPQIELGNGDRRILQNLWSDADAIRHETGHHLIYTRLTDIGNRISVIIHEGLADAQVLLANQSPCLCPTVCTEDSPVCFSQKCLRSAANNFTMAAPSCTSNDKVNPPQCLPTEIHQRSQIISGLLWDIAQVIGPSKDGYKAALQLEMRAITYLSASSEYTDLLEALIKADQDLGGNYRSIIIQEMCARGFDNSRGDKDGSWMSGISVPYTCPPGSGDVPKGHVDIAPSISGAYSVPTTATGSGGS